MANLTGTGLASFAKGKKGTPYVYGAKGADGALTQVKVNFLAKNYKNIFTATYLNKIKTRGLVGKVCTDCSGLISWYTGKVLGSSQMYSSAYTRLPIAQWKNFAIGTVLWKQGHVGVYLGDGLVAEARGIDEGTVISKITDQKWAYGLTFSYINYDIKTPIKENVSYKGKNPYQTPSKMIKRNQKGEDVKWMQWELVEAGFNIRVDGIYGPATETALKTFQRSSKIEVDGICGPQTISALINE